MSDTKKPHAADDQEAIQASQDKFRSDVRDENVEGIEAAEAKRVDEVKSTLEADQAAFRQGQVDANESAESKEARAQAEKPENFPQESTAAERAAGSQSAFEGVFTKEADARAEGGSSKESAAEKGAGAPAPEEGAPAAKGAPGKADDAPSEAEKVTEGGDEEGEDKAADEDSEDETSKEPGV